MAIKRSEKNTEVKTKVQDIVDVDLGEIQKKKFRLDRDNNRVIELNTSDISVVKRLEEIYPKMLALVDKAHRDAIKEPEEGEVDTLAILLDINNEMKKLLNYAFDSDIADKACPNGTLYDPINGKFRFEYIMEKLINLYDENFTKEFDLMKQRVDKHTSKYTKSRKKS